MESSLEVLLMLALLSRFFLQSVSLCLVWLDEGGDEEELVLARESSSDIPLWIWIRAGTWGENQHKHTVATLRGTGPAWDVKPYGKFPPMVHYGWCGKAVCSGLQCTDDRLVLILALLTATGISGKKLTWIDMAVVFCFVFFLCRFFVYLFLA